MPFQLTEEQRHAVEDRGGELLVSAAAGSGKTRVLEERLLDRVRRWEDIDRFLVITYTRAAASELRSRIARELTERLARSPGDRHLRRQAVLIYHANISTIHAFCAQLLRENAAALDLDPDFRLGDEEETLILQSQTLLRLLERRYEQITPGDDFARLVDTLSAGRDDSRLAQIVLDVFGRIQSHPDPEAWLAEQERVWRLEGVGDAADTPWGAVLLSDARDRVRQAIDRLKRALEIAQDDEALSANYADSIARSISGAEALLAAGSWEAVRAALPVEFPPAGRKRGAAPDRAQRVKMLRDRAKKALEKLEELFELTGTQALDDLRGASPAVRGLMALVRDFGREYAAQKRRRNLADFSDLEHLALRLLCDENGAPTPLAESWGARFSEVMVDEFQDANRVQNAIFHALSGGGRDLFLVGDVKQSIYRFRLADPTIFLEYYRTFAPQEGAREGEPRKLLLTSNFRSRPEVLQGVNELFSDLMSTRIGEMEYTRSHYLVPGAEFPSGGDYRPELDVVKVADDSEEESEEEQEKEQRNKDLCEARAAALRIRQLLDAPLQVGQEGERRPLRSSDVMLLLRAPGPVLHHYIRALSEQGIPWTADLGEDFFASTEVNVALALLEIVDNPRQDVALISALRSPVYAFSADRLAELRAGAKGDFYAAVEQAAREGAQDCAAFLAELDRLRFGAGDRTCSQLVWHVYQNTNLPGLFSVMPDGESRRAHLMTLYELARDQEQSGCRTLFGFLLYLRRLRQTGQRVPAGGAARRDGVRIMSIHRAKGLEAPVVLVCGLGRRFNRDSIQQPVLFHPDLGVGPRYLMTERGIELNTIARRAVALTLEREMMSEELRLLYVAMTRAREKLILSLATPRLESELLTLWDDAGGAALAPAMADCPCVGHWVLLSALGRPWGEPLRRQIGIGDAVQDGSSAWEVRVVEAVAPQTAAAAPRQDDRTPELPEAQELYERFSWQYPHAGAVDVPSKITATQLKGRVPDQEAADQTLQPLPDKPAPLYRPRFASEGLGLTPTQRGNALHLAMQFIDFARTGDARQIDAEIERLVEGEFLTAQQGQAVDTGRLAAFFRSPLGREVLRAEVHREFKFSMLVPAGEYFPQAAGEELLLQGVVDCWYDTPDGIVVLDFKSDRVSERTVAQRARDYTPQLVAYARALGELTGRPVSRRVLWFFELDRAVEV